MLGECDHNADSRKFVELLLTAIYDALCEIADTEQVTEQVKKLLEVMSDKEYSTKELMEFLGLKHSHHLEIVICYLHCSWDILK
ncbi:MAG: hypothetical protein LIR50_00380 [Bacillota bacterium]|nr:hypothetical protein [Bacillota bacterium]